MTRTIENLEPRYDSAKSFYGKAYTADDIVLGQRVLTLYSYDTPVASAIYQCERVDIELMRKWDCSHTTLRHVKEFIKQQTGLHLSKQELNAGVCTFSNIIYKVYDAQNNHR